jgi:putative transposase
MRYAFIRCPRGAKHRHIWPVSWLCDVLEVSRSGFHAWLNRPTSAREIHDAKLVTAIETSFKASDRTHGARHVWRDVLDLERQANGPGDRLQRTRGWPAACTGSNG